MKNALTYIEELEKRASCSININYSFEGLTSEASFDDYITNIIYCEYGEITDIEELENQEYEVYRSFCESNEDIDLMEQYVCLSMQLDFVLSLKDLLAGMNISIEQIDEFEDEGF